MSEPTEGGRSAVGDLMVVAGILLAIVLLAIAGLRSDRRALCPLAYTTYGNPEDFYREHSKCRYMLNEERSP